MKFAEMTPQEARERIRSGEAFSTTSGMSMGYAQCNLVIVPAAYAADFHRFCTLNPKSCPLLYVSEPGETSAGFLGRDIDIRTDVPGYKVFTDGIFDGTKPDIRDVWQDDLVTFYIGCSFSFEEALLDNGVYVPHMEEGKNVAMYNTDIPMNTSGRFHGNVVVSMRPLTPADAIKAVQVTTVMSRVHGAPIHLGDASAIGIRDISKPDYGDAIDIPEGSLPTYWACGVSPQVALQNARLPFAITHAPGQMIITDLPNWTLRNS